jgi:ribosomal protein S18 acetylase RimI-like enzyme
MLRAFDHFRARGAEGVELKVGLANRTGAQRLYRDLGMREIAPY